MSIPVDLENLATEVGDRGPGYLLTSGADGRPHTIELAFSVDDSADGAVLRSGCGKSSARNIAERPLVALLWPPTEPGGYSLIVDGEATIEGDADTRMVVIAATHAILHRPASGGGNDCKTV